MAQETLLTLSWIILLLPMLGFIIIIFNQQRLTKISAGIIGTSILGIDLLLAIFLCYTKLTAYSEQYIQTKFHWFELGKSSVEIGIGIDNLAAMMLIVVTLISFLVHLFSLEYMYGDKRFPRFYAYLGLFSFSMLGIVIGNNFLFMYIFWELVGISSYLLIGFWYEKDSASNAGKKAFIANRIGDLGFFTGIMILFFTYKTFMFDDIFAAIGNGILPFDSGTMMTAAGILIFCGAIGKSAQFPLHVWLPDAMEGPTSVSALIHAATMVAAGVYMTARVFPMFTAGALTFIAYIGAITAFISATIAITQNDFKRVLAYSTVSQLGYMIMALGIGAYTTGFFHLVTHAWFKACLFLASGSVIHAMHHSLHHHNDHHTDPQDIRNMGGLRKTMPYTYATFLMATLAICGVPLTSGFLSKDTILAATLAYGQLSGNWLIPIAGFGAAGMTAFYMFRLTIEAFHGKPKNKFAEHTKENNKKILIPLVVLSVLSLWFFYSFNPINASTGWFYAKLKAPATVVPHNLQFKFLIPFGAEEKKAEARCERESQHNGCPHSSAAGQIPPAADALHTEAAAAEPSHPEAAHQNSAHHEAAAAAQGAHAVQHEFEEYTHKMHYPAMIASLLIAGLGILLSFCIYQFKLVSPDNLAKQFGILYKGSYNKWWFDEIYAATAIGGTVLFSKILALFDNKVIDGIVNGTGTIVRGMSYFTAWFDNTFVDGLVNLTANITGAAGALTRKIQTGKVQTYVAFAVVGVILLIYFVW